MSLYTTFKKEGRKELQKQLEKENIHETPKVEKVIVAMGIGSLATRKGTKDFSDLEENMRTVTGQQPQMIYSKQAVSNFKLKEGMPVMLKTTLRGKKAYDFLERMVKLVLPRVRDFSGLNPRSFDGDGNFNVGFPTQAVFAELSPEEISTPMGVQININTTTDDKEEAMALLKQLGIIFQ